MGCSFPIHGYRKKYPEPSGKFKMTINPAQGNTAYPMTVPCGKCTRCRLEKSRQWAVRCVHESMTHDKNCFITLTYNKDNLPKNKSLVKRDFQLFMKKLRRKYGNGIRYFHCGEYGERGKRPHYHACLFGFDFPDRREWKDNLDVSDSLERLWGKGFCTVGDLTFESAAYVARYVLKKVYGPKALEHYAVIDKLTGEITSERVPEYTTMSRRPGIGAAFYEKYQAQINRRGEVTVRGRKMRTPRFYDLRIQKSDVASFNRIKTRRKKQQIKSRLDNTVERLETKERCAILNQKNRRKLE